MNRSSGILLPVSALPGPCGIGDLGKDARDFIDFLAAAGQRYWQILPLNPPDGAHSPYLSASTFAGSTDLLSPEPFLARGALTAGEVRAIDWGADPMRVDYDRVHAGRTALWDAAFAREKASAAPALRAALAAEPWLRDYCLYMAMKEEQGGAPWYAWPQPLRDRSAAALAAALERLDDRVLLHAYLQTEFTRQWDAVRAYAHAHGVRIIGDLPMYIAPDSADVWAQPAQFRLDPDGQPSAVAGVPPDYFSADGQLWGNPLYDWDAMRADGFRWWKDRIRGAAKRYDVVRLDHFRAISSYWVVPRGELTARGGHWAPGPGPALLQALHTAAPELELIAEDLGTHDNAPAAAWAALGGADADYAMRCLGVYDVARLPEALLRAGMGSRAELFIAQMQDVLGLGAESRMNTPGTAAGNWVWRLLPGQADARTAARLLARTQAACRA